LYGSRFGAYAQSDHVADSGTRQQGDGRCAGKVDAPASRRRLAKAQAGIWKARFHLSKIPACGVRGRLLLALLSKTWDKSEKQSRVLAAKIGTKQKARQIGNSNVAASRLARDQNLGV